MLLTRLQAACLPRSSRPRPRLTAYRFYSEGNVPRRLGFPAPEPQSGSDVKSATTPHENSPGNKNDGHEAEDSALARRFAALAEDAALSSPKKASSVTSDPSTTSAISSELKDAIAHRLASAKLTSDPDHVRAHSIASMPSAAPKHSRDLAASRPWVGTEETSDTVLRMLNDAHKPLRGELAKPSTRNPTLNSIPIDLRPTSFSHSTEGARRAANARDASISYASEKGLSQEEREEVRRMFRDRFTPHGRPAATVSALISLADQRIEDARARGQFRNLPRGKPLEHDHNASSPFLDTTEYFLNKIIQRQEVLPPWVEKQQELSAALAAFRGRLRYGWKWFAARHIAAAGGSVEEQCRRADAYARAEERRVRWAQYRKRLERGEEAERPPDDEPNAPTKVFRSSEWENLEESYNRLTIEKLNELTRSYNLLAPELAKKPYLALERELERCYAEVAPMVRGEIIERAKRPRQLGSYGKKTLSGGGALGGKLGLRETVKVYETTEPKYGFRELWRDLFKRE